MGQNGQLQEISKVMYGYREGLSFMLGYLCTIIAMNNTKGSPEASGQFQNHSFVVLEIGIKSVLQEGLAACAGSF